MKITEIKALLPGSGKTYQLCLAYAKYLKQHSEEDCILLTPTNKSKNICIRNLKDFGLADKDIKVKTIRSYKGNYISQKIIENGCLKEHFIPTPTKQVFVRKPLNIFIDEASMVSKTEMEDLIQSRTIKNLVLAGDSLQFEPIGYKSKLELETPVIWFDKGETYIPENSNQIILDEQIRASDSKLLEVLDLIKKGELGQAIDSLKTETKLKRNQLHIAYRKETCRYINSLYENPERFIAVRTDSKRGIAKGELINLNSHKLETIKEHFESDNIIESIKDDQDLDEFDTKRKETFDTFEDWFKFYFKPAYAVNCHKLQGETIKDLEIVVHLEDMAQLAYTYETQGKPVEELLKEWQKYLYVAISRATSIDQVKVGWYMGKNQAISYKKNCLKSKMPEDVKKSIEENPGFFENFPYSNFDTRLNKVYEEAFLSSDEDIKEKAKKAGLDLEAKRSYDNFKLGSLVCGMKILPFEDNIYSYFLRTLEEEDMVKATEPMVDETLKEGAIRISSKDRKCTEMIISGMDNSKWNMKEMNIIGKEAYADAHRVTHKSHKIHTEEEVLAKYKDILKYVKLTPKQFQEKTGKSVTLYYKLKKILKEEKKEDLVKEEVAIREEETFEQPKLKVEVRKPSRTTFSKVRKEVFL